MAATASIEVDPSCLSEQNIIKSIPQPNILPFLLQTPVSKQKQEKIEFPEKQCIKLLKYKQEQNPISKKSNLC